MSMSAVSVIFSAQLLFWLSTEFSMLKERSATHEKLGFDTVDERKSFFRV